MEMCKNPTLATPAIYSTRTILSGGAYTIARMMLLIIVCLGGLVSAQDEISAETNILRMVQGGVSCIPGTSGLLDRLSALKQTLSARASLSLYAQSGDIDPVSGYGACVMYQCRGDLALSNCARCVKAAFDTLDSNCSNPGFAQVELQGCGVIYSNQSIEGGYYDILTLLESAANGSTQFLANRDMAVANVTKVAIENKRTLGTYWAVDAVGDASQPESVAYALAQCHGYLPPADCAFCLSLASYDLSTLGKTLGGRSYHGSCYVRFENYIIYTNNTPTILTSLGPSSSVSPPALSPLPSPLGSSASGSNGHSPGKGSSVRFVVVVVVAVATGIAFFIMGSLFGWCLHCAHKTRFSNQLGFGKRKGDADMEDAKEHVDLQHASIQRFSLMQLEKATNNFDLENKIGEGGFGVVYLGMLENGDKVAIKKLMHLSSRGKEQFLNEVKLIKSLQHRNLVKIIGCSVEGENGSRFIVYEYLSNQSLDKHLFASSSGDILPWNIRREILEGVARGLTYLHHDSHLPVIHRDIKAANILLDDDFNPKIADFGLAKLFASDKTHMSTKIAGTLGYIAPEYAMNGQVSVKSDIFSFGLLMLEVISGRRVVEVSALENRQYLLHWTWRLHEEGRELEMVDASMQQDWVEEEVQRFIHIALLCCQTSPAQRPSMLAVAEMLVDLGSVLHIPTMPTYRTSKSTSSHQ